MKSIKKKDNRSAYIGHAEYTKTKLIDCTAEKDEAVTSNPGASLASWLQAVSSPVSEVWLTPSPTVSQQQWPRVSDCPGRSTTCWCNGEGIAVHFCDGCVSSVLVSHSWLWFPRLWSLVNNHSMRGDETALLKTIRHQHVLQGTDMALNFIFPTKDLSLKVTGTQKPSVYL